MCLVSFDENKKPLTAFVYPHVLNPSLIRKITLNCFPASLTGTHYFHISKYKRFHLSSFFFLVPVEETIRTCALIAIYDKPISSTIDQQEILQRAVNDLLHKNKDESCKYTEILPKIYKSLKMDQVTTKVSGSVTIEISTERPKKKQRDEMAIFKDVWIEKEESKKEEENNQESLS